nr:Smr/MutS family protein [Chloroflexota bacterium]
LPGRSNAFAIAQRLGLDTTIIADARTLMPATDLEAEKLLDEIHRQRDLARHERALAEAVRADALTLEAELTRRLERIEDERRAILDSARDEAAAEAQTLQTQIRELRRRLQTAAMPLTALKQVETAADDLADDLESSVPSLKSSVQSAKSFDEKRPVKLGDTVWLPNLKTEGAVLSLTATEAEVQIGRLRVRAKLDELQTKSQTPNSKPQIPNPNSLLPHPHTPTHTSPGLEIDIRGQTVEDGLMMLDRYLESAYMANLPWVRIIHGKGTGKLRQAVRDALRANELVLSHQPGVDAEGGEGVTVARLAIVD